MILLHDMPLDRVNEFLKAVAQVSGALGGT
jgi:hypothetical protein